MSEHGTDRTGAGEGPEVEPIDDTTMAEVTEPILRALESTASATSGMLQSAQGLLGPRRSPRLPESGDVASSVVEVGLRAIERAALLPRQMMRGVFGEGMESRTPPPPATEGPRARAQPVEGQPARGVGAEPTVTYLMALDASQAEKAIFFSRFGEVYLTLVPKGQPDSTTGGRDQTNALRP